jgi:hypothetical protein
MDDNKLVPVAENTSDDVFNFELVPVDLPVFVNGIFDEVERDNAQDRLNRYKKWAKNRAFYRGNQRGFWDSKQRTWVSIDIDSLPPSDQSVLVVNNQFRPQVKTLAKEFSRSQTRIRTNPLSDSQDSILAGRFSDALIRFYQPKLMTETKRQLESKFLMLCGNSFRYDYYSQDKKSAKVNLKTSAPVTLPEYKKSACPECGYVDDKGEATKCPECGATMQVTQVPPKEAQARTGYKQVNAGDPETEVVDPVEIEVWSGAQDLDHSPYLRRRRLVKEEFIVKTFPFYSPKKDAKMSDSGQDQWKFFDHSTKNKETTSNLHEYQQLWIDVERYYGKKLEKAVSFRKQVNGAWTTVTLKEGTILHEEFPDGMYICKVDGDILYYSNEAKKDHWIHIPFDTNVDGFWADGLEDAVMNQQIINEYTSLSVENVLYNASPKLVLNPTLINPVQVTGRPKDLILMSDNASRDKEPKNAFAQINGMSLTAEVQMGIDASKRDMREQTGALVAFNGQGDPTLTTATAMSIARDSALALVSTPLSIRAEKEQEWCRHILQLVKTHWYDQKYKFLLGKYNEAEAEAFRDCVLDEEINIFVESNSWMPQTNFERLSNLGAYLTAFGIPMGFLNPTIPQVVRDYASQLYNIPFDFNEVAPDTRIAQKRLELAKEVAAQQIPKAMAAIGQLKAHGLQDEAMQLAAGTRKIISDAMGVEEDIDDHAVFISEYIKWLKTDEGQNAHPILREAIKMTIADHRSWKSIQDAQAAEGMAMQNMAAQPPTAGGGAPPTPTQGGGGGKAPFQPEDPASHPFSPQKLGEVQDFSDNAKSKE